MGWDEVGWSLRITCTCTLSTVLTEYRSYKSLASPRFLLVEGQLDSNMKYLY